MVHHDSHLIRYREPLGPIPAGGEVCIRFLCNESTAVTLRTWDGSEHLYPMTLTDNHLFEATITMPETPMLYWYDFIIHGKDGDLRYGNSVNQLGGEGFVCDHQPASYQITVYDPAYHTPEYIRHGVVYQIFPDRFFKDAIGQTGREERIRKAHPEATFHDEWNEHPTLDLDPETSDNRALDFFGGTLRGIAEKLDELKDLGVSILYINPVFRARTNHRYDTGSYEEIDPILGSDADFDHLIAEADKRGMKVMLDGVFSHTGSDSLYFNRFGRYDTLGAYQSMGSPYHSWYTFYNFPNEYRTWWGFQTLPTVNKDHPTYHNYLLNPTDGILPRWVRRGACGWRLDVADELPMNTLRDMRKAIRDVRDDAVLLGEVWEDASNKVAYGQQRCYCLGDTLDSVMNYPLRRAIIDFFTGVCDAHHLRRVILHQQEVYPAPFFYSLMNLLGSHDRVRILNAMAGYDREGAAQMDRTEASKIFLDKETRAAAQKKVLEAIKLLCALPGAPTIYYGDEIGMQGMADPWNRAPMDWDHADEAVRSAVKQLLNHRLNTPILQTGHLTVEADGPDALIIKRYAVDGKDVFGQPVEGDEVFVRIAR